MTSDDGNEGEMVLRRVVTKWKFGTKRSSEIIEWCRTPVTNPANREGMHESICMRVFSGCCTVTQVLWPGEAGLSKQAADRRCLQQSVCGYMCWFVDLQSKTESDESLQSRVLYKPGTDLRTQLGDLTLVLNVSVTVDHSCTFIHFFILARLY